VPNLNQEACELTLIGFLVFYCFGYQYFSGIEILRENSIFSSMKNTLSILIAILTCLGLKAQTTDSVTNKFNKIPYMPFDVFAKFPGGDFEAYVEKNIQYPAGQVQNINGQSVIAFSIDRDGNVINVQLLKNLSPAVDREIIRVFNASPKWTSAKLGGDNVKVNIGMRLMITTDSAAKTIKVSEYKYPVKHFVANENSIYTSVSEPPQFPGDVDSLHHYLNKNIIYPAEQLKNKTGGQVILSFVIEKDGSLSDIKAARSPDEKLSEEAIRVMRPFKFINGTQNGYPVRVAYYMAVKFDPDNPGSH
jgi:TonB family protein